MSRSVLMAEQNFLMHSPKRFNGSTKHAITVCSQKQIQVQIQVQIQSHQLSRNLY